MIKEDQLNSALYSIHLILSELRTMAHSGGSACSIGEVLDWLEAMPFLIAKRDEDRTTAFRHHLCGIVEKYPQFQRVLDAFDTNREFYR